MTHLTFLHIATDEKFINSAEYLFNRSFPDSNTFVILTPSFSYKAKHLRSDKEWIFCHEGLDFEIFDISKYDFVVFHNIDYRKAQIINANKDILSSKSLVWLVWGAEVYNNKYVRKNQTIGQQTRSLVSESRVVSKLKDFIYPLNLLIRRFSHPHYAILKAIRQIEYVGIFKEDFEYFKSENLLGESAKHLPFSYYPIEFLFRGNPELAITGDNILVGNSATTTNNHIEVFKKIKHLPLEGRKIIVPLNYGDNEYAKKVAHEGFFLFGDSFQPLLDFLPLNEYQQYTSQCGIVIMNHYRQQALGTILGMIWVGAKVFLSNRSTIYQYLIRIGIKIFSVENDLVPENKECLKRLAMHEVNQNREILLKETGEKVIIESIKNSLSKI